MTSQNPQNGFRKRIHLQQENNSYNQSRNDPISFTNQYNIYNPILNPIAASPHPAQLLLDASLLSHSLNLLN